MWAMCRRSTGSPSKVDISIAEQKAAIRKYRKENLSAFKWGDECFPLDEAKGFYVDLGVSAWKNKFRDRPAASRLLRAMQPGDHLLIYSVDRGFRNVVDFGETVSVLAQRGIEVHFVTQDSVSIRSAAGKLVGNILATIAQYSSDIKSERVREAFLLSKEGLLGKKYERKSEERGVMLESQVCYPDELRAKISREEEEKPGTIWPYIRCSHIKRVESGLGLEVQRRAVKEYCSKLEEAGDGLLDLHDVISDEAVSAFTTPFHERPGGKYISDRLQEGDHVVVYRLDRAWRSINDAASCIERWLDRGVHVHLVSDGMRSDSPMGKLHFYTLSYIAWVESYLISLRGKKIVEQLRKEGRPVNQEGCCMKQVIADGKKKLTLDPDQIAREKYVYDLGKEMGISYRKLSDWLEERAAEVDGRRPFPPDHRKGEKHRKRYWTRNRVYLAWKRSPKYVALAEKYGIKLPTPEELEAKGKLFDPRPNKSLRLKRRRA